jgi:ABC-2 type transport system ATP-binding protein
LRQISIVMGNKMQLWWDLPAIDSFDVLRELYEVEPKVFRQRRDYLVETLLIQDKIDTQVRKLSLGERMKCELVAALLHAPKVIFLDEPTIGLDVVSQKRIREFLKELHQRDGCTIILTSHYMQDVQELCERVIVVDHGSKVFEGTLGDLSRQYTDSRRLRLMFRDNVDLHDLEAMGKVISFEDQAVVLDIPRDEVAAVTSALLARFPVVDIAIEEVDVEEVIHELFTQNRPAL